MTPNAGDNAIFEIRIVDESAQRAGQPGEQTGGQTPREPSSRQRGSSEQAESYRNLGHMASMAYASGMPTIARFLNLARQLNYFGRSGPGASTGEPVATAVPVEQVSKMYEGTGRMALPSPRANPVNKLGAAGETAAATGSMEGLLAGAAELVPPVIIALVAMQVARVVGEEVGKAVSAPLRLGAAGIGVAARSASGDNAGATMDIMGSAADAAAEGLGTLVKRTGILGEIVVGVTGQIYDSFGSVVKASRSLIVAFEDRAMELRRFNPQIASAVAQRDIRQFYNVAYEAQALGPGTARLVNAQSRVDTALNDIWVPIKRFLVEKAAVILEDIASILEEAKDAGIATEVILKEMLTLLKIQWERGLRGSLPELTDFLKNYDERIAKAIVDEEEKRKHVQTPMDFFLKILDEASQNALNQVRGVPQPQFANQQANRAPNRGRNWLEAGGWGPGLPPIGPGP